MHAIIFVTDDEPAIRSDITKQLTRQGHHAVGHKSGEALLERYQCPWNVREFQNILERALVFWHGRTVTPTCLTIEFRMDAPHTAAV